ncbi:MAG: helix-turn-helix transcriptional regulator [Gracilibacteraceae bacterium]|jgi:transcriptional regulator with XRE-family HTH domain|nr:helix-turn-helix transcriptional regulator [Gracilibacteraceae bacterium]
MEAVSKRMTELRESLKLSQLKLSKLLGVSQSAINRYEHNLASVPDNVLLKYSDYFDVSADYILGRTDKPEGDVFKNEPELLKRKTVREDEWMDFVEACFDPRSPMNKKLKALVMNMAGGDPQK